MLDGKVTKQAWYRRPKWNLTMPDLHMLIGGIESWCIRTEKGLFVRVGWGVTENDLKNAGWEFWFRADHSAHEDWVIYRSDDPKDCGIVAVDTLKDEKYYEEIKTRNDWIAEKRRQKAEKDAEMLRKREERALRYLELRQKYGLSIDLDKYLNEGYAY
jgi:hypothetical protein